jgi:hypothetical protein
LVVAVGVYVVAAGALLLRALIGHLAIARLLATARPAPKLPRRLFRGMARGLWPRPRLVVSDRVRGPVCCGLLRPTVVLPVGLAGSAERGALRWVFAHELAHLARRDSWAGLAVCLCQVLYFHLPWFWWLRKQVRLCQEYVADAAAAAGPATPVEYAAFLVRLSGAPAVPLGATGVLGSSSDLYRRVTMLLQSPGRAASRGRRAWSLAAAGALVVGAVCLSGLGVRADDVKKDTTDKAKDAKDAKDAKPEGQPARTDDKKDVQIFKFTDGAQREEAMKAAAEARKQAVAARDEALRERARLLGLLNDEQKKDDAKDKAKDDKKKDAKDKAKDDLDTARKHLEALEKQLQERGALRVPGARLGLGLGDQEALQKQMDRLIEQLEKDWQNNGLPKEALDELKKSLQGMKQMPDMQGFRLQIGPGGQMMPGFQLNPGGPIMPGQFGNFRGFNANPGSGRLGVQVQTPGAALVEQLDLPKEHGLVISEVVPDSAAAKAGLKANDILLEFAGKAVPSDPGEFIRQLGDVKADQSVDAVVLRKGRKETVKGVKLPEARADARDDFRVPAGRGERVTVPAVPAPPRGARAGADTRREPEAPLPPLPPRAVPPADAVPAVPLPPLPRGGFSARSAPLGGASASMSVSVVNGDFTIESKQDNLTIKVTGKATAGGKDINSIEVHDGDNTYKANKINGVPEKYRDRIKELLDHVQASN